MEEKRGPGRPKGSKNLPKVQQEVIQPPKVDNSWRIDNGYMLPVINLDYSGSLNDTSKTLLGFVEDFGDWDFGIKFPYFFGAKIPVGVGGKYWNTLVVMDERINKAFVSLGPDTKPKRLLLFGQQLLGKNLWGPEKSVLFSFSDWTDEYIWMEP